MSTLPRPLLLSLVLAAACAHTQNAGSEGAEESAEESAVTPPDTEMQEGRAGGPTEAEEGGSPTPTGPVRGPDATATSSKPDFAWDPRAGALELDDVVFGNSILANEAEAGWESRRLTGGAGGTAAIPGHAHDSHLARGGIERAVPESVPVSERAPVFEDDRASAILGALGTRGEAEPPTPAPAVDGYAGEGMRAEADEGATGTADALAVLGLKSGTAAGGIGGLGAKGRGRGYGGSAGGAGASGKTLPSREASAKAKRGEARGYAEAPVRSAPLRAGATDDNAAFGAFVSYLDRMNARGDIKGWADVLDVTDKRTLRVLSPAGDPLPAARVSLVDPTTERIVWSGHTFGDGRLPVYPNLLVPGTGLPAAGVAPSSGWMVQAEWEGTVSRTRWDGKEDHLDLVVDAAGVSGAVPLDVCFVIDTTGSMGDEIARIKETLLSVTEQLRQEQAVDLRYGAVLYRDLGDAYVTRRHPFTSDLEAFDRALQEIEANGGGDGPESLNQGLAVAVGGMDWRDDTARVAFVVADAPPHMDYQEHVTYGRAAAAALHQGIKIHTVAASGLDDRGSLAFRQVSQLTRGEFIFIEYGSTARSAADHGVTGQVTSNNLDAILYKRIHDEIVGWGRNEEVFSQAR